MWRWWSVAMRTRSRPPRKAQALPSKAMSRPSGSGPDTPSWPPRAPSRAGYDDVVVVFGDTPLVEPETLTLARAGLAEGYDIVVIGFEAVDPTGYGRLLTKDVSCWQSASIRTPAMKSAR